MADLELLDSSKVTSRKFCITEKCWSYTLWVEFNLFRPIWIWKFLISRNKLPIFMNLFLRIYIHFYVLFQFDCRHIRRMLLFTNEMSPLKTKISRKFSTTSHKNKYYFVLPSVHQDLSLELGKKITLFSRNFTQIQILCRINPTWRTVWKFTNFCLTIFPQKN